MRTPVKHTIAASLAALTLGLAVFGASPASANPWHHHGFWGPGIGLGILGLAAGAAVVASEDNCVQYRPIYDRWGNYLGQRPVDVCR